jgi:2-oxoglutarate dehydrogenase E2 component (dihydrolipoamide succinyltransferase)
MSIVEVKVPQLSESVAEATLLQWKKQPGEAVAIDEILIEIETDKVVLEVPAPAAGVLAEHVVASGGTVVSDQVIARIDTAATAAACSARACGRTGTGAAAPAAAAGIEGRRGDARRRQADGRPRHGRRQRRRHRPVTAA